MAFSGEVADFGRKCHNKLRNFITKILPTFSKLTGSVSSSYNGVIPACRIQEEVGDVEFGNSTCRYCRIGFWLGEVSCIYRPASSN